MKLTQQFLTQNDCYQAGRTIVPRGIMVHSTGVAQPDVEVFLKSWDRPGVNACVHAFVHTGGVVQTLPWDRRGWHAGTPRAGGTSANNTHISFEILEPAGHTYRGGTMVGYDAERNAGYFAAVYRNAVELCAMLCRRYGLDPMEDILDHSEGYARGIASNHGDVAHWFPRHGKRMDDLRGDVRTAQRGEGEESMTQEQFDTMFARAMAEYTARAEKESASGWARDAWERAAARGVFDGTKPRAPLTREQAALALERLGLLE